MAAIARLPLEITTGDHSAAVWSRLAAECTTWAAQEGVALRDAVVLLPFAQLLPPARQAFARAGGWQPRIETTQTLARALGPAAPTQAMQLSFDAAVDRMTAARLLQAQSLGAAWAQRDARGFERAVALLVETAQAIAWAAAARPPETRSGHWQAARQALVPIAGPGARERWLARVALEWAALAPPPDTDRLFALRPSAWIVLQAGGEDTLAQALLASADGSVRGLLVDADPVGAPRFDAGGAPARVVCDSFEAEAQCAAAQVLAQLAEGRRPVALVGQDRLLVRRVRALLERSDVRLHDETGWTLSTTRAAAQVMLLLRAAASRARTDDLFDWLKTLPAWPGHSPAAVERLERACRRLQLVRLDEIGEDRIDAGERRFWLQVRGELARLHGARRSVTAWIVVLREALAGCGAWPLLQEDVAGRAVIAALRLETRAPAGAAWQESAAATVWNLEGFTAWVDQVLEQGSFMPAAADGDVVVAPVARLMLRPFAAVVWPGADDRHLGARGAPHGLLDEATLRLLGLPDAAARQQRERQMFAAALRLPRITFLRRRSDAGEPLVDSPLLEGLALDLAEQGRPWQAWTDPRTRREVAPTPQRRPAPSAASLLPSRLSASAAEALRDCPYRFHARHLLRLREDEELDDAVEKRDYGTWLHAVLHEFHAERGAPGPAAAERSRLQAIGERLQREHGLSDEAFLPFAASFETFATRYVAWLHERDAAGDVWQSGEQEHRVALPPPADIELQGVIDRIDNVAGGAAIELIDYKTGSAENLRRKQREPFEDTQLAFYAALVAPEAQRPVRAMYLALDDGRGLVELAHAEVARSAAALLQGLGDELARLRAGAGLPALGEGSTCEHCEARGLCRRDHWSVG